MSVRQASAYLLGGLFIVAGLAHFIMPETFRALVPPWLPEPETLVAVSGAAEIAGGLGLFFLWTRRAAAGGLILLLFAVFPANVHAALHATTLAGYPVPAWMMWARLPLQGVLIWWVYVHWKAREGARGLAT